MDLPTNQQKLQRNEDIISCLTSNECYFLIYSSTMMETVHNPQMLQEVPDILVFKNSNDVTIRSLVQDYNQKYKRKTQTFQLCSDEYTFGFQDTILDVKRRVRKQRLDGTLFFIYTDTQIFSNQCCVVEVTENEKIEIKKKDGRRVHFEIEPTKYSVYVDFWTTDSVQEIKVKLAHQINRVWGKKIPFDCIDFTKGDSETIYKLLQTEKLTVKLKGFELPLPKENKVFLTIKKSKDIEFQTTRFQYSAIESKKVIDLLQTIDEKKDWRQFGLQIGDTVIKSNQVISEKCQILFQKSQVNIKNLVGVVLREVHVFQAQKSKIEENNSFNLQSIVDTSQKNQQIRVKCHQQIQRRANQTSHQYFKGNFQHVEPILLYTSQLKVKPSNGKKYSSIFRVVNEKLRSQNFTETSQEDYSAWEYQFQCILLNKLSKLDPLTPDEKLENASTLKQGWTNRILWRGQSYMHNFEQNEIVSFKQFVSTTEKESVAKGFASQCILKIIKSKSGRSIKDYSIFVTQAEVLFSCYTTFKILKKDKIYNDKKKKQIVCFEMEELEIEAPPPVQTSFILWVDDKTTEGKKMWSQFTTFQHSTILVQLLSTEELEKWLNRNQRVINNTLEKVTVAMISNMTRKEKEKQNGLAGVDAIKVFRKYLPHGNIFLYIGNRKLALQKLQKNGVYPSQELKVSSIPQELKNFLKSNIKMF